jgi:hypothetical protein
VPQFLLQSVQQTATAGALPAGRLAEGFRRVLIPN